MSVALGTDSSLQFDAVLQSFGPALAVVTVYALPSVPVPPETEPANVNGQLATLAVPMMCVASDVQVIAAK